tara:strand:- start:264 stop:920 length:657 start_codon:yes stop_codon:yes gene_type:complete
MGYLNNGVVMADCIITDKGRQLLAKGDGSFTITQFALGDDEIDYTLYNPNHPSGSAFYGQAIENMPLIEAIPDSMQSMKYKLVTLPRGTAKMPVLDVGYTAITLRQGASLAITPQTLNYLGDNQLFEASGYTATLGDIRTMAEFVATGIDTPAAKAANQTVTLGTAVSKTVIGTSITLRATTINTLFGTNAALYTTLTVIGRDSGARLTVPVTITQTN